jgi:CRP-like cAMP-binding protein
MEGRKAAALDLLFRRIEVRDDLSADEKLALLGASGEFRMFAAGDTIVHQGDRPKHCTLLVNGFASRFSILDDGGRQITAVHVAGDFVDLHSFPLKRMDHNIGALSECEILQFPHTALTDVTSRHPHLTRLLWMLTLLDGAIHRRWLVAMGRTSALSHTAHLICELYLRLEAVGKASDFRMQLPLTQIELADTIGISSVHANRVLQELRASKMISWEGREVRLLDWNRLADVGRFDDEFLFREKLPR